MGGRVGVSARGWGYRGREERRSDGATVRRSESGIGAVGACGWAGASEARGGAAGGGLRGGGARRIVRSVCGAGEAPDVRAAPDGGEMAVRYGRGEPARDDGCVGRVGARWGPVGGGERGEVEAERGGDPAVDGRGGMAAGGFGWGGLRVAVCRARGSAGGVPGDGDGGHAGGDGGGGEGVRGGRGREGDRCERDGVGTRIGLRAPNNPAWR